MRWMLAGVAALVSVAVLAAASVAGLLGAAAADAAAPSSEAADDIPPGLLTRYGAAAATCPGLSWTILAAIGKLESDHGRSALPGVHAGSNWAGAAGPMQFGIGGKAGNTWAAYGLDGDGDGVADVYNPADAIASAAGYLCDHGAHSGEDLPGAVFAYNPASSYVREVLAQAQHYAAAPGDAQALLGNPRLELTEPARHDLDRTLTQPDWIDPRVIALLNQLTQRSAVTVSVLRTGHSTYVKGTTRISNHAVGRGVDISQLDGVAVSAANPAARALVAWLLDPNNPLRPSEVGSPFAEFSSTPGGFSDTDHQGHIHVGYSD